MAGDDTLQQRRNGLRLLSIVVPIAGLAVLYPIRLGLLMIMSEVAADVIVGLLMCAGVVGFSSVIFQIIVRQDRALAHQFAELERRFAVERRLRDQIEALHDSSLNAVSADSPDAILGSLVALARELIGAHIGLLGVLSSEGELGAYYTASQPGDGRSEPPLSQEQLDALRTLLQDDTAHYMDVSVPATRRVSSPPGHDNLRSVIGVPMLHANHAVGGLYLGDKVGASEFSADDERLLTLLANQAAIVVQNSRLKEQVRLLAIAAERERIQKDLHDGMLQSIFAVNLELEGAVEDIMLDPAAAQARIDLAIDRLDGVMEHIRNYIVGLRTNPTEPMMDMNQEVQRV